MRLQITLVVTTYGTNDNDINTRQAKVWTANGRLSVTWKSDLSDEIKRNFFQAAVVSILLYGCTTWTRIKPREKKLDGNCLYENTTSYIKEILEATFHEIAAVRTPNNHLENYAN